MGKGKKKEPIELFPTFATVRNMDPPAEVNQEDVHPGEFRETAILISPSQQKNECSLTIRFRCTTNIVRGDVITIRLTSFKGVKGMVFALESRPHPDNELYHNHFQAYYTGETSPKGVPPQCIILKCRSAITENSLVIIGVPETVHIVLPEKLALNSAKLKIEGQVRHAENGKIPRSPIMECSEVRKRPVQDDIAELEAIIQDYFGTDGHPGILNESGKLIVQEITQPEADAILDSVADRRALAMGIHWRVETSLFTSYEESVRPIMNALRDPYKEEHRVPLALHREIANNFGIKLPSVMVLEDALYTIHGAYYPELSRAAIMVLRLYSMEAHDLSHMLEVFQPPCMYREIHSAIRSKNPEMLRKWLNCIATLTTCTSKLSKINPELIPVLYSGIRDLPAEQLARVQTLKKGDWFVTSTFLNCCLNVNIADDNFSPPDYGVLLEIHKCNEAIEIGDCSQYPEDREWLLPLFSSFEVVSVEVLPDKNNITRLVLEMKGSFGNQPPSDEKVNNFPNVPRAERTDTVTNLYKRARIISEQSAPRTAAFAKCIYANLRLMERKMLHPQHLLHAKYLEQFAETQRQSRARRALEENLCRWLVCTAEQQITPDGVTKPATWETLNKKYAFTVEACFLKRTRALKQFSVDSIEMDFNTCIVDYGKGPLRMKRMVGKVDSYPFQPM